MSLKALASKRRSISPILATIILIVITVVAGVMLYGFVTGFFSSSATANSASLETSLTIPSGATAGTFVMTVKNSGTTAITGIDVALKSPNGTDIFSASWMGGISPGNEITIYGGNGPDTISASGGALVSAPSSTSPPVSYINARNVVSGESYNYIVTVTFANGASKTYTGSVTASAF